MTNLSQVSAEEMDEVVRIASDLYERERHKKSVVEAAGELGVPQEYIEQAAQVFLQTKLQKTAKARHDGYLLAAALCIPIALLLAFAVSPLTLVFSGALIIMLVVRSRTILTTPA